MYYILYYELTPRRCLIRSITLVLHAKLVCPFDSSYIPSTITEFVTPTHMPTFCDYYI